MITTTAKTMYFFPKNTGKQIITPKSIPTYPTTLYTPVAPILDLTDKELQDQQQFRNLLIATAGDFTHKLVEDDNVAKSYLNFGFITSINTET